MAGRFLKYDTTALYFHFHATQVWIFNKCCCGVESQAIVRGNCFLAKYSSWKKLQFVHDFKRNICYIIFDVFPVWPIVCLRELWMNRYELFVFAHDNVAYLFLGIYVFEFSSHYHNQIHWFGDFYSVASKIRKVFENYIIISNPLHLSTNEIWLRGSWGLIWIIILSCCQHFLPFS